MNDQLKNFLIVVPVLLIAAFATMHLWDDYAAEHAGDDEESDKVSVGVIAASSENIKRKAENSLYWNPIASGDKVFAQDSIRSGGNSYVTIQLYNSAEIELSENSLITVDVVDQNMSVNFKAGDIQAKSGNAKLSIYVNNSTLQAQNAEIKLKTGSDKKAEIIVQKGSATLKGQDNKVTEISKENMLKIDEKGATETFELAVTLNTPKDRAVILDDRDEIKYPFTWNVLNDKVKDQIFEMSSSPQFPKDKTFSKFAQRAINIPVKKGTSYWRVGWKSQDKTLYSETRTLTVREDKRIQLVEPINQSVVQLMPGEESVDFAWKSDEAAKLFVIEVSTNKEFTQLLSTETLSKNTFEIKNLPEGTYWWRVQAFGQANEVIGKSVGYQFTVKKILPQFPVLKSPANGTVWTLSDPLLLEWQPMPEAKSYRLKITTDATQKSILKTVTQTTPSYLWTWTQPGIFYWSVEALNDKNAIVGQSVVNKNQISPSVLGPAITLMTPTNQETATRERRDPIDPVVFTWKLEKPLKGKFTLAISETADFKQALKKDNIEGTRYALRLSSSANYYWKVLWQDPADPNKKEESATFVLKFRLSSKLPPPQLVEPLHEMKRYVADKQELDFSWYMVKDAESYHIVLERFNSNTKETIPVMDRITKERRIKSPPLEPGTYQWSVSSMDKENIEGPTGEVRKFSVEIKKELSAPKLNAPMVK